MLANMHNKEQIMPLTAKCFRIFEYKLVLILSTTCLVGWIPATISQIIYCFKDPSAETWMQYGPIVFAPIFLIVQLFNSAYCYLKTKTLREEKLPTIDLNCVSPLTKLSIIQKSKTGDRLMVCIVVILMTSSELMRQETLNSETVRVNIFLDYIVKHFPTFGPAFIWYQKLSTHFLTFVTGTTIFYLYYFTAIIDIELLILEEYLENYFRELDSPEDMVSIRNHIIAVTKKHQKIMQFYMEARNQMYLPYILFGVGIVVILIFNMITIYSGGFRISVSLYSLFGTVISVVILSHKQQRSEDLSEEFCMKLYNLEWYEWDKETMKIFHILLTTASKSFRWTITPKININHKYLMSVIKVIYTIGNLLRSLTY